MLHVMIPELQVDGDKARPTGWEVCSWCGLRRERGERVGEETEACVGKPDSVRGEGKTR